MGTLPWSDVGKNHEMDTSVHFVVPSRASVRKKPTAKLQDAWPGSGHIRVYLCSSVVLLRAVPLEVRSLPRVFGLDPIAGGEGVGEAFGEGGVARDDAQFPTHAAGIEPARLVYEREHARGQLALCVGQWHAGRAR